MPLSLISSPQFLALSGARSWIVLYAGLQSSYLLWIFCDSWKQRFARLSVRHHLRQAHFMVKSSDIDLPVETFLLILMVWSKDLRADLWFGARLLEI